MTNEEVKNKLTTLAKFKPNPNHYIIIDKWNKREFNKVKFKILNMLEEEIDKTIAQNWIKNFTPIKSAFPSEIETQTDWWETYKQHLPLWSNINTNCYFKLKES